MNHRRRLAATALGLAAAAPLAGTPHGTPRPQIDIAELARLVERGDDHVTAIELAEWIRARRSDLRVLDVRSPEAFDLDHLPGAEPRSLDALATGLHPTDTIVLYSDAAAHAAQGWVFLRALGFAHVYFLRGGMYEWDDEVLNPLLAVDATDSERADFARASELSHYYGGTPRTGVSRSELTANAGRIRRRGC